MVQFGNADRSKEMIIENYCTFQTVFSLCVEFELGALDSHVINGSVQWQWHTFPTIFVNSINDFIFRTCWVHFALVRLKPEFETTVNTLLRLNTTSW